MLKTHVLDGERIYPYGFFARFEKRNGLPLPIEDPILLDRFADDFGVHRTEPGLSIVVPYFRDDELSLERITASVVRPSQLFLLHGTNARLLLHPPVHQHGAFIYDLGFRRDLITNRGLIEAIDLLYWDAKRNAPKRGATTSSATTSTACAPRRFSSCCRRSSTRGSRRRCSYARERAMWPR